MATRYGLVIDIETTGLDVNKDVILEVAAIIFNLDTFEEIDYFDLALSSNIVIDYLEYLQKGAKYAENNFVEPWRGMKYVYEMHTNNGLINQIIDKREAGEIHENDYVASAFVEWMKKYGLGKNHIQVPLTGSSVHFDRKFLDRYMPAITENVHYRNCDVSTMKVMVDQWMPKIKQLRIDTLKPDGNHRALDDCRDTLSELKFYKENVFDSVEGSL